jgi:hypothetical protein
MSLADYLETNYPNSEVGGSSYWETGLIDIHAIYPEAVLIHPKINRLGGVAVDRRFGAAVVRRFRVAVVRRGVFLLGMKSHGGAAGVVVGEDITVA